MRLLDTQTLELRSFTDYVPPYAILSHCWEEEEVSFADLSNLEAARLKKGFLKVQRACERAVKDNYDYLWIDSCAIDKSSSAELSEAINSMFVWYRGARMCYIYLADVDGPSDLSKSRWFTRAWTLQELLAPCRFRDAWKSRIKFLDRNWQVLSNETTSSKVLSEITGIPQECFDGIGLYDASISMRMSWAAGRQATRPEDIAYALLGIFDVNMPLLYGEGKIKAFHRLQEEIMKVSEDETLFAWVGTEATSQSFSGSVLANDPADFTETKHLLPFNTQESLIPHTMTHRGLHIRMQLMDKYVNGAWTDLRLLSPSKVLRVTDTTIWGVLRCYHFHDPFRIVIIPLRLLDSDMYIRDRRNSLATIPSELVPDTLYAREIYIRNGSTISIANSVRRRFAFLIRSLPSEASITRVSPTGSWQPEERILHGHRVDAQSRPGNATVELSMNQETEGQSCSTIVRYITLGLYYSGDDRPRPWCHVEDPTGRTLTYVQEYFQSTPLHKAPHYTFDTVLGRQTSYNTLDLKVAVTPLKVFGQVMFVVDIESFTEANAPSFSRSDPLKVGHTARKWLRSTLQRSTSTATDA